MSAYSIRTRVSVLLGILGISFFLSGCPWDKENPGGFFVITCDVPGYDEFGNAICIPHPNVQVNGSYVRDIDSNNGGDVYRFPPIGALINYYRTDASGHLFIQNGRMPATWDSTIIWNVPCGPNRATTASGSWDVTFADPNIPWGCGNVAPPPPPQVLPSPQFSVTGSTPATIAIPGTNVSTQYGMPQLFLYVYNSTTVNHPILASQMTATSVSSDGTTATFSFPTAPNGSALSAGVYAYGMWNVASSSGDLQLAGTNSISLGSNDTSKTTPYGVDVYGITESGQDPCSPDMTYCSPPWGPYTSINPVVTLSSTGKVNTPNGVITVGSQPTAIKVYGSSDVYTSQDYGGYYDIAQPSNAIVTNFGSNTVSILDTVNSVVVTTISVGTQPITVVLSNSTGKAYVANYGSSSVSEINLSTNTQSRVASVGTRPEALCLDPGGTALWIGGLNYISKIDLSSLSTLQSFSVSGQVTSLAVSAGQNSLVYTTMSASGGSTTFQAQQASLSNFGVQGTYAQYTMSSSSYYAEAITSGGPAPGAPGWLMSSGALVSSNYGNSAAVVGTPTGFAVIDLHRQVVVMQGNAPSAVRGMVTDPSQGLAYVTAPDSNSLITVPLPNVQQ